MHENKLHHSMGMCNMHTLSSICVSWHLKLASPHECRHSYVEKLEKEDKNNTISTAATTDDYDFIMKRSFHIHTFYFIFNPIVVNILIKKKIVLRGKLLRASVSMSGVIFYNNSDCGMHILYRMQLNI